VLAKEETVRLVHALNSHSPPGWTDITGLARHIIATAAHGIAATAANGCDHADTPEVAAAFALAGMNLHSGAHGRPLVAHKTGAWRYSLQRILACGMLLNSPRCNTDAVSITDRPAGRTGSPATQWPSTWDASHMCATPTCVNPTHLFAEKLGRNRARGASAEPLAPTSTALAATREADRADPPSGPAKRSRRSTGRPSTAAAPGGGRGAHQDTTPFSPSAAFGTQLDPESQRSFDAYI
jgi:hypothetical protein